MSNPIPDQPQKAIFTFWQDLAMTTPLSPEPDDVIFTLSVTMSSNDALHPPVSFTVGSDPSATRLGPSQYQLVFNPTDYGIWRVDIDGFDVDDLSVGAQFATIVVDPRPAAIPVAP